VRTAPGRTAGLCPFSRGSRRPAAPVDLFHVEHRIPARQAPLSRRGPRVRLAATSGRDGTGLFAGPAVPVSQSLGTPLHALSRSHSQARARTTGSCRKRAGYVPAEDQFVAAHDRVAMSPHPVASARPVDASCMRRRVQVVKSMVPRPSGPRLVRIQSAVFGAGCERPMRRGAGPTRRLGAEVGANCRSQDWTEYGAVNWPSVDWRPAPPTGRPVGVGWSAGGPWRGKGVASDGPPSMPAAVGGGCTMLDAALPTVIPVLAGAPLRALRARVPRG
jgi:hypothetical protein